MDDTSSSTPTPPLPQWRGLNFDFASTIKSPFFWFAVGAASVIAFQYYSKKQAHQSRFPRNVTPGVGE